MNLRLLSGLLFVVCALAVEAGAGILYGPVINPANGRAYYLLEADTWQNSVGQAYALGGQLVVINDQAENEWVTTTFGRFGGVSRNLWLGLSDAAKAGAFEWVNREAVSFTLWKAGEPDNAQEGKNYAFLAAPTENETGAGGEWATSVNAGDGGVVPFHGVVEADHLEHDSAAVWSPIVWSAYSQYLTGQSPWWLGGAHLASSNGVLILQGDESYPRVRFNPKNTPAGTPAMQPYELVFEPSEDGDTVSGQWVAPTDGKFLIEATFSDVDPAGDGQDAHISVDGTEVFTGQINAAGEYGRITYFSPQPLTLRKQASIVIKVGSGGSAHTSSGDSTRVDVSIRYVGATIAYTGRPGSVGAGFGLIQSVIQ